MMYAIDGGQVASYDKGQGELVYVVLKFQSVAEAGLDYVFTDRHAATGYAAFYTDPAHLRNIDWNLMASKWWNNVPEYPDRKERKQAEFLVHGFVPWGLVDSLAGMTPQMKQRVEAVLVRHSSHVQRPVRVERD